MGILNSILEGLTSIGSFVLDVVNSGISVLKSILGLKRHPPRAKIRAALRQQYIDLLPGETEIEGVEWEGVIYRKTPE